MFMYCYNIQYSDFLCSTFNFENGGINMNGDDILVRCFGVCDDSEDLNKLLELLLSPGTVVEKEPEGYRYYIQWWDRDRDIVNVLKDTIPDAVKCFDYDSGKVYDFRRDLLVLDGWERPLSDEFVEKMGRIGKEESIEFKCSDYVDMRYNEKEEL